MRKQAIKRDIARLPARGTWGKHLWDFKFEKKLSTQKGNVVVIFFIDIFFLTFNVIIVV